MGLFAIGCAAVIMILLTRYLVLRLLRDVSRSGIPRHGTPPAGRAGRGAAERTAIHEAGHVLVDWISVYVTRVTGVRLAYGANGELRGGETKLVAVRVTPGSRWDRIVAKLAGIAAETRFYGNAFSGDSRHDLAEARAMAEELAVAERESDGRMGPQPWDSVPASPGTLDIGSMYRDPPDARVREILNESYRRAKFLIDSHRQRAQDVADALLERNALDEKDLEAILGERPFAPFRH